MCSLVDYWTWVSYKFLCFCCNSDIWNFSSFYFTLFHLDYFSVACHINSMNMITHMALVELFSNLAHTLVVIVPKVYKLSGQLYQKKWWLCSFYIFHSWPLIRLKQNLYISVPVFLGWLFHIIPIFVKIQKLEIWIFKKNFFFTFPSRLLFGINGVNVITQMALDGLISNLD